MRQARVPTGLAAAGLGLLITVVIIAVALALSRGDGNGTCPMPLAAACAAQEHAMLHPAARKQTLPSRRRRSRIAALVVHKRADLAGAQTGLTSHEVQSPEMLFHL